MLPFTHGSRLRGRFQSSMFFMRGVWSLTRAHSVVVQVGEMLERPSAWPHFRHLRDQGALKSALEDFNREQGGPRQQMPVYTDIVSAGRGDLVQAIKAAGDSHHASMLGP